MNGAAFIVIVHCIVKSVKRCSVAVVKTHQRVNFFNAFQIEARSEEALSNLAAVHTELEDFRNAVAAYERLAKTKPDLGTIFDDRFVKAYAAK